MPWTLNDYPNSLENLEKTTQKKAIDIANALIEDGYKEGQAIPIATEQAKKWYEKTSKEKREAYYKEGEVTKHNHKYKSNPELLEEDELVIKQADVWAVKSKGAKKATKTFNKKEDAVQHAKKIVQNKKTKLHVYKVDGSLQKTYDYSKKKNRIKKYISYKS